jgi:hypothetical protein
VGKRKHYRSFGEVPKLAVNRQGKNWHHLTPRSQGGSDEVLFQDKQTGVWYGNVLEVDPVAHWHYHSLFKTMRPAEVAEEVSKWIPRHLQCIIVRRTR